MSASLYLRAFEDRTEGMHALSAGVCDACPECMDRFGIKSPAEFVDGVRNWTVYDEGGFSWHDCDLCGSTLGGDRYVYHWVASGRLEHGDDACSDCVMMLANGEEPEDWRRTPEGDRCRCSDPGCPACDGACEALATVVLDRVDTEGSVEFCEACADDAMASGVFS